MVNYQSKLYLMRNVFTLALLSFVMMMSCTKEREELSAQDQQQEFSKFYAATETAGSRIFADVNYKLYWTEDDRITIFDGNTYPLQYKFLGETGDNCGEFDVVKPVGYHTAWSMPTNYAVYPYDKNTSIAYDGTISYIVPTTQAYAENSFGLGANLMVAVTDGVDDKFLAFKNLGSCFEFPLYGTGVKVMNIEFKGNNGEKLAGASKITAAHGQEPTITFADDATEILTLDCGDDGVLLSEDADNPTKFWIVVPAITFEKGFTITITDTNGIVTEKSVDSSVTIERSKVQSFEPALELETIQSNQVWCYYSDGESEIIDFEEGEPISLENFLPIEIDEENLQPTNQDDTNLKTRMNIKSIVIPEGVEELGFGALAYCTSLESVKLPSTLKAIGMGAFGGCSSLKSIDIPIGVKVLGQLSFGLSGLESVNIPLGVERIGFGAFAETNLKKVVIPNSVTGGLNSTFSGCEHLEEVVLSENIVELGNYSFENCKSLKSIIIPANVEEIEECVFEGCESLEDVKFAENSKLRLIFNYSFRNCTSLTSIILPASLTDVEATTNEAFAGSTDEAEADEYGGVGTPVAGSGDLGGGVFVGCTNLKAVYSLSDTILNVENPTMGHPMPYDNEGFMFYVPNADVKAAYDVAESWGQIMGTDRIAVGTPPASE